VLGSLNMDIVATASHHPQLGETVLGDTLNYYPGGKGLNQAVAAARNFQTSLPPGAPSSASTPDSTLSTEQNFPKPQPVTMLGAVGDDAFGQQLRQLVASEGIAEDYLTTRQDAPSGVALITVAESDNTIVVVPGAYGTLSPQDFAGLQFCADDVLLAQFEVPKDTTADLFAQARLAGATTILNPAPASPIQPALFGCIDYLVVNDVELEMLAGAAAAVDSRNLGGPTAHLQAAKSVLSESLKALIHTRGSKGVAVTTHSQQLELPAHQVAVVDTTAAGDCFCGVLAASLLRQETLEAAVARANAAAALCVQSPGATPSIPVGSDTTKFQAMQPRPSEL